MRELPVAIPMPDWNAWLPVIHPVDAFDTDAVAIRSDENGNDVGQPYFEWLYDLARVDPTPSNLAGLHQLKKWVGKGSSCCSNGGTSCTSWRSLNGPVLTALRFPGTRHDR